MDDLIFYLLSALLALAIFLLITFLHHLRQQAKPGGAGSQLPLPPGPKPVPIIGPLLFLVRSNFDIEPIIRHARKVYGPVISLRLLNPARPAIFVADRAAAHRALVQSGTVFSTRPPAIESGRILSSNQHNISSAPYGATWRALRRNLASEMLHPSRVRSFGSARQWVFDVLEKHLLMQSRENEKGAVVVMESFQYAMFCLLVYMCFGERVNDSLVRDIESVQREILGLFVRLQVFAVFPKVTKVLFRKRWNKLLSLRRRQEELFLPLIQARRHLHEQKKGSSDGEHLEYCYVDSLINMQLPEDGGRPVTDDEIVSLCSELLSAGTDTTATALQWILANLVRKPEMQEKLRREIEDVLGNDNNSAEIEEEELQRMEYLKAVVLEGLRRHPPGHFVLPHTVTEDTTLDGYRIPKGSPVNFTVAEIGWDEEVWSEPMEFKPERFLAGGEGEGVDLTGSREIKMMPFGAGRRICPGLGLALLHLEYFVANLVQLFEWREVEGEEVDLTEKLEFTVVMKHPLKARIVPRRSHGSESDVHHNSSGASTAVVP